MSSFNKNYFNNYDFHKRSDHNVDYTKQLFDLQIKTKAVKIKNPQFGKTQNFKEVNKFENNYYNKNIINNEKNKIYVKRAGNLPNSNQNIQNKDLTKAFKSQPKITPFQKKASNDIDYTQTNNFFKGNNSHLSIESKDKNQRPASTSYAQMGIKKSPNKSKNPSNFDINKFINSEKFSVANKTKPLKSKKIARKHINLEGNIHTPIKNQDQLENSNVESSSKKKNTIIEFNMSDSQADLEQSKKANKGNNYLFNQSDISKFILKNKPNTLQSQKETKNTEITEIIKKGGVKNSTLDEMQLKLNTKNMQLTKELEECRKLLNDKQQLIDNNRAKQIKQEKILNLINKELEQTKKNLDEKISDNNNLWNKINNLKKDLKEKDEELIKIKEKQEKEIENKDKQINQLLEELENAKNIRGNNIEELKGQLIYKEKIISQNELKISELAKQLEKALNEIKQMEINNKKMFNNQELKNELEKKEKDLEIVERNLLDRQNKIKNKERELNEKTKFIEQTEYELQSELDRFNRDKKQYSDNFNNLKKEINDLNIKKLELEHTIKNQMEQINNFNQRNVNNNNNLMNMNMNNSAINNINYNLMNNMGQFMNSNMMMNPMNFPMNNSNFSMNNSNLISPQMNNIEQFKLYNPNFNQINNNNNQNNQIINNSIRRTKPLDLYKEPTLIGLQNIGATCFMNATLQCLSQTADLTNYFLDEQRSLNQIMNNNIAKQNRNSLQLSPVYLELVKNLWNKNNIKGFYQPKKFMETIEEMNPLFKLGQAGDSKDFILFIFEQFHKELTIKKNNNSSDNNPVINQYDQKTAFKFFLEDFKNKTSIISDIFYGIQETNNICLNCKKFFSRQGKEYPICYNYQIFNCLIFPLDEVRKYRYNNNNRINAVTIEDCFYYNQKMDLFTGLNKNYCNICKQTCNSNYITKIYSAPDTLVLILNRGKNNCFNIKLNFKETLDITDFVSVKSSKLIYNLYGVITHYGESGPSAHFLAFCKSPINQKWYRYNDAMVSDVHNLQKDVIEFGNPYILFYKQEPLLQK